MSGVVIQIGADVKGAIKGIEDVSLSLKEQKAVLASLQKQYAALSTEQARSKIGKEMAADIKIAKDEIARLSAGATSGFGAVGQGATKAFSAVRQFAYVLPGIGVAGIVGGLADMVAGLLSSASAFDETTFAAASFDAKLSEVKRSISNFESSLTFNNSLQKKFIDLTSTGGPGSIAVKKSTLDFSDSFKGFGEFTSRIKSFQEANDKIAQTISEYTVNTSKITGNFTKLGQLIQQFGGLDKIPEGATKGLTSLEAEMLRQYRENTKELISLQQQRNESFRNGLTSFVDIIAGSKQAIKDQEDKLKEIFNQSFKIIDDTISEEKKKRVDRQREIDAARAAFERLQNETIARASRIFSARKNTLNISLDIQPEDSKAEQFRKANQFLQDYFHGNHVFKVNISPKFLTQSDFDPLEFLKNLHKGSSPADPFKLIQKGFVTDLPKNIEAGIKRIEKSVDDFLKRVQEDAKTLGDTIGKSLFDAFTGSFSAIGEGIGNVLSGKGFGSGITDVFSSFLKEIGEALIQFGAIKEGIDKILGPEGIAIPGAFAIGLGVVAIAASKIFSNIGHRAAGGPVNQPVVVGERGPEIYVPSTTGRIIPNNQLGGLRGAAAQMILVTVQGVQRGRDIVYLKSKEERFQANNV